ncbi:unnamed protein product [Sphagnum troendelagicum]|uniref:Uncharacterized protein n=1 Tax=Sphagnum troendelagicum TaxID=128251 RepID=A0ABP0TYZ7_9BRYO
MMASSLPKIKERVPYWEAFKLDRSWSPLPPRRTTMKSTFGPQVLSLRCNSPNMKFGTQGLKSFEKMYISAEMTKTKPGNFSPGPAYKVLSSFGRQPISNCESPPEIKWGTGSRFNRRKGPDIPGPGAYKLKGSFGHQVESPKKSPGKYVFSRQTRDQADKVFISSEFNKTKFGTQSPGPMVYGAITTFGPQAASKNRTAPVINFTKGLRVVGHPDMACAGPGEYKIRGSVGKQPESQKLTLPAFSFPHCTRRLREKVFLSKDHDRAYLGKVSPGPAIIGQFSSMGNQADSRCTNPPFIRFTKGIRWNPERDEVPGPGAYDV